MPASPITLARPPYAAQAQPPLPAAGPRPGRRSRPARVRPLGPRPPFRRRMLLPGPSSSCQEGSDCTKTAVVKPFPGQSGAPRDAFGSLRPGFHHGPRCHLGFSRASPSPAPAGPRAGFTTAVFVQSGLVSAQVPPRPRHLRACRGRPRPAVAGFRGRGCRRARLAARAGPRRAGIRPRPASAPEHVFGLPCRFFAIVAGFRGVCPGRRSPRFSGKRAPRERFRKTAGQRPLRMRPPCHDRKKPAREAENVHSPTCAGGQGCRRAQGRGCRRMQREEGKKCAGKKGRSAPAGVLPW